MDVTAPNFRPDVVLTALIPSVVGELSWGLVQDTAGTTVQRALTSAGRDAVATTTNWTMVRTDAGIFETLIGGAIDWYGEFGSFDSQGFTITTRTAGANSTTCYYLALSFGGAASSWVGTFTTPTATGNSATTAPGFRPQFVLLLPNLLETAASSAAGSTAHSSGISALDADEQYSVSIASNDNVGTTNTQSLSDDVAASLPNPAGVLDVEATFVSFDTTGFTLNFSNITAVGKIWPALAIQEFVAASTGKVLSPRRMDGLGVYYRGMDS